MTAIGKVAETAALRRSLRDLPAPEPSAGLAAYHRERELALAASPAKRANYERYLTAGRGAKVDYLPIKLDIENASRCNFKCTMCPVSDWTKGRRADDMSLAAFQRLIDEQYGLIEIKLQGIGEPTMQRDDFFAMIRYARAQHIWVRTTTNASLLHLNDNARKLIDSGANEVQISVDGADAATFESIRRGAVFKQVMSNIRAINAYARERGRRCTKMWTVVQRGNVHQLAALVDLAAELGFQDQVFALNLTDWGLDSWASRNAAASVENVLSTEALLPLVDRGAGRGIKVRFWNVNEKYQLGDPKTLCPWPFERAFVASDLRVVPCCYLGNPDVYQIDAPLGDARSFSDVWRGKEFQEFRQAHLDGNLPKVCRGCYSNPDRE